MKGISKIKELLKVVQVTMVIAVALAFVMPPVMSIETITENADYVQINSISSDEIVKYDDNAIYNEVLEIPDKSLTVEVGIGDRYVQYWEHVIHGFNVKNDSILIHSDPETGEIIEYKKKWSDIVIPSSIPCDNFEPNNRSYFWKENVVFPDDASRNNFYDFYETQSYPIFCWEVRFEDGTTVLYDLNGEEIGCGIPAPYEGFSLSGFNSYSVPDPWMGYRLNADYWFSKWCTSTNSVSLPTPSNVSYYVQDPDVKYFYELAHGDSRSFQVDRPFSCYYSFGGNYNVYNDMTDRSPMRFAFIGGCEGMTDIGPYTFSYELRKGEMIDTVTVGYTGMGSSPGWNYAFPWQKHMFKKMDEGYTIKESFDLASARYPLITDAVVFVGDETMHIANVRNSQTHRWYETIQEAINDPATQDGHIIYVYNGIYNENIIINKSISLIGENKNIISATNWWNTSWNYRKLITIYPHSEGDLTNFPLLVYNVSDPDLASHAQDDGDDIAFVLYSDNTQLNHEIEWYNGSTGELAAWVNVASLNSDSDTEIWMYYGNSNCDSQENITGVWDNKYVGVWHLKEAGNGAAEEYKDSTSYGNNGQGGGGESGKIPTFNSSGKVDGANDFDGENDYVDASGSESLDITGSFTLEAWINPNDVSSNHVIVQYSENEPGGYLMEVNNGQIYTTVCAGDEIELTFGTIPTDTWTHVAVVWDNTVGLRGYINGECFGEALGGGDNIFSPNNLFCIGSSTNDNYYFNGTIDEVRISNIARNFDWTASAYNTMNDPGNFMNFGKQNVKPTGENKNTTIIKGDGTTDKVILVQNTTFVNIVGFTIRNGTYGVYVESSSNTIIADNIIFHNKRSRRTGAGIYLRSSENVVITDNEISNNAWGIHIADFSNNATISNNDVHDNIAFQIQEVYPRISGNDHDSREKEDDPSPDFSPDDILRDDNLTPLELYDPVYGGGIKIGNSDNNIVTNNTIIDNYKGIIITSESTGNLIFHNNLVNNMLNAFDAGDNQWDNGYSSGGNHWSNYTGIDIDPEDGIGDTPYNISGGDNQDRYPLMEPWKTTSLIAITVTEATPFLQEFNGPVNVTCRIIGDVMKIDEVYLNITYPDDSIENISITQNKNNITFYCNVTYSQNGTYNYFIWVTDTTGAATTSAVHHFWICSIIMTEPLDTGENYIDVTDEMDAAFNINTTDHTNITLAKYTEDPYPNTPRPSDAFNKYINIDIENESAIISPINIRMYYKQEDLDTADITEDKLVGICFWNETTEAWEFYNETGVSTTDINGYAGYLWANAYHLTPLASYGDITPPEISYVKANPVPQEIDEGVNITGTIVDNVEVGIVKVNIIGPVGFTPTNVTMDKDGTDSYYYNQSYSVPGKYTYFIWISDYSGNANMSAVYDFYIYNPTFILVDDDFNLSNPGWQIDHFNNIRDGLNHTINGGTVYVFNGTYYENVVIDKTLDLTGEDKKNTVIDGCGSDDVVYVSASWVNITGFTIKNCSRGINIYSSSNNTIYENNISCFYGLLLSYSHDNMIFGNTINGNANVGIWPYFSFRNTMYDNDITNNGCGIWLSRSSDDKIFRNNITNNDWCGIFVDSSSNNIISANDIHSYMYGIYLDSASSNLIYHNNFLNSSTDNVFESGSNIWYNATLQEGNYWSDFDEPSEGAWDNNSDAIVDDPYDIPPSGSNQDNYPLINPWKPHDIFPPVIKHKTVAHIPIGSDFEVKAVIRDDVSLPQNIKAFIDYRPGDCLSIHSPEGHWLTVEMKYIGGNPAEITHEEGLHKGIIPARDIQRIYERHGPDCAMLEYRIKAKDEAGNENKTTIYHVKIIIVEHEVTPLEHKSNKDIGSDSSDSSVIQNNIINPQEDSKSHADHKFEKRRRHVLS